MNSELAKAQEHARRFQDLLSMERRKQKGLKVHIYSSFKTPTFDLNLVPSLQHALEQELRHRSTSTGGDLLPAAAQRAYVETLSETLSAPNKPRSPMRLEDVVRKSEVSHWR